MDKGTLYRLALAKLGSSAELVEGTPEYKALEDCSQQAVAFALDYSAWDFAEKGPVELPLVDGSAELPGDCLEVREVYTPAWQKIGREIVVGAAHDGDVVRVRYKSREIADMMALPSHEPLFCEACVMLVAAAVAGRVTGNANIGLELQQMGLSLLYRAKMKEARAVSSNDQMPKIYAKKGGLR